MNRRLLVLLGSLQVQNDNLQLCHWNLKLPDFITMHEYLGNNYERTSEHVDAVAELMRMHDNAFLIPEKALQVKSSIVEPIKGSKSVTREDVLNKTLLDIGIILQLAGKLFKETAEIADINDYMAAICADYKKRAWFIKQSM